MIDQIKIGGFLRELRKEKELTQEQLAEKFGVSSRSVSRWENGNTMPELGILVELADYYEVDIKEIIDGERKSEIMKTEEKEIKGERKQVPAKERYPVVTIVLYFGQELWNYPKSLKECFEPPLAEDEITKVLKEYIQDYRVHLFDIPRLTEKQVQLFQSDFKIVADYFTNVYNTKEYVPDDAVIAHVDEFLKLMKVQLEKLKLILKIWTLTNK